MGRDPRTEPPQGRSVPRTGGPRQGGRPRGGDPGPEPPQGRSGTRTGGPSRWGEIRLAGAAGRGIPRAFPRKPVGPLPNYPNNSKYRGRALAGEGGNELTRDPASRRATVIPFGLCVVAASAIA